MSCPPGRGRVGRMSLWLCTAIGVAVAGVLVVWRRRLRKSGSQEGDLTSIVLEAMAEEWAARTDTRTVEIRAAVMGAGAPELRTRLRAVVREVEVVFTKPATGQSDAHTVVRCTFGHPGSTLQAETATSWDDLPASVRREFIRQDIEVIHRRWILTS